VVDARVETTLVEKQQAGPLHFVGHCLQSRLDVGGVDQIFPVFETVSGHLFVVDIGEKTDGQIVLRDEFLQGLIVLHV
jgi:hypothetical protein